MAESTTVTVPNIEEFKQRALRWAEHFNVVCLLDSNNYSSQKYATYDWVLAVDKLQELEIATIDAFKKFQANSKHEIFGYWSYDVKNQIEKLSSNNPDKLFFPDIYFFEPRYLFKIEGNKVTINRNYPETFELIELISNISCKDFSQPELKLRCSTSEKKYFENVNAIKLQIAEGDFYELNYCLEFFAEKTQINPVETFLHLNKSARAPFSCFLKLNGKYLLCASPERFLKKEKQQIISQPIKGTIRKSADKICNDKLKSELQNNSKERAENVMIVDLVRNDLGKSSKPGTVGVEELFGVYEFNTVNQMISTVVATATEEMELSEIVANAFPMGSMTGAPKIEVMKNIERYENFKRGLYSGTVGYFTPDGNFDLNVVIRSILYNATENYVSVRAGSAITYDSVPEKELEEILLKAENLLRILNAEIKMPKE
jgi:para-aminobenzoate synthetase component 1